MSEKEFWRSIPDYKNYEASNTVKIRNVKTGELLNPIIDQNNKRGKVRLCKNGYSKGFYVDYLIALAFRGEKQLPNTINYVCHINGDVTDNNPENLNWKPRGVCYLKKLKKWIAQIMINNEHKYLGLFNSKEEAGTSYMKAYQEKV